MAANDTVRKQHAVAQENKGLKRKQGAQEIEHHGVQGKDGSARGNVDTRDVKSRRAQEQYGRQTSTPEKECGINLSTLEWGRDERHCTELGLRRHSHRYLKKRKRGDEKTHTRI